MVVDGASHAGRMPEFRRQGKRQGKSRPDRTPMYRCNQACLDHTFGGKISTCLVTARLLIETELRVDPADAVNPIAVVGAGPAGLSAAIDRGRSAATRINDKILTAQSEIGAVETLPSRSPQRGNSGASSTWYRAHDQRNMASRSS